MGETRVTHLIYYFKKILIWTRGVQWFMLDSEIYL